MTIDLAVQGDTNPDYIIGLCDLATLYRREGRYAEAGLSLEHALELVDKLPTDERSTHSIVLIGVAHLHAVQGEYSKAEQRFLEVAKQRLDKHHWLHPEVGRVYDLLSHLYWKMGRKLAAERSIHKALRTFRAASHTENLEYATMLAYLGNIQVDCGKAADARVSYSEALDVLRRINGSQMTVAKIQKKLAMLVD